MYSYKSDEAKKIFDFEPIPGFCDKYLVRVNNSIDNCGIFRAFSIMEAKTHKSSKCSFNFARFNHVRHKRIGKEVFERFDDLERKQTYGLEDLNIIQNNLNKNCGDKYNILVFDGTKLCEYKTRRFFDGKLLPIYEGNPKAKILIPLLQYRIQGKLEYCGLGMNEYANFETLKIFRF